ncbi:unnamed protein product, partial [Trichobilharzia regenti]
IDIPLIRTFCRREIQVCILSCNTCGIYFRIEHLKYHEKHRGHEKMHLEMFLVAVFSLFLCQMGLMYWKQRHFRSYQLVTLIAMWLVPFIYSIFADFSRFVVIWVLFSLTTGAMVYLASKKRISTTTPRRVYRWFLFIHTISYILGVGGYILMMLTFFQVNLLFLLPTKVAMDIAMLALFYGLYYGVIARDFAEVCTNKMAAQIPNFSIASWVLYQRFLLVPHLLTCLHLLFASASSSMSPSH